MERLDEISRHPAAGSGSAASDGAPDPATPVPPRPEVRRDGDDPAPPPVPDAAQLAKTAIKTSLLAYKRARAQMIAFSATAREILAEARAEVEAESGERSATEERVKETVDRAAGEGAAAAATPAPSAAPLERHLPEAEAEVQAPPTAAGASEGEPPRVPGGETQLPCTTGGRAATRTAEPVGLERPPGAVSEVGPLVGAAPPRVVALGMVWRVLLPTLLAIVAAAAAAYLVAAQSEKVYAARSEIAFKVRDLAWDSAQRFLATQEVVVQSRSVLAPIATEFAIPVKALAESLEVSTVRDSGVLRIEYQNVSPATALEVTEAITDHYLRTLRDLEQVEGGMHRLLTPAFLLEDPVAPDPLRAAAIGALAGLIIAAAVVFLVTQVWQNG